MATLEQDMRELLDALVDAYTAKRPDQAAGLFTPDAVVVGTGGDEVRFGIEQVTAQVERDLSQSDSMRITYDGLRVGGAGDVAWCYADVTAVITIGRGEVTMPMRFTGTARRSGDTWRFAQMHLSMPFGGQAEGESFARPPGLID